VRELFAAVVERGDVSEELAAEQLGGGSAAPPAAPVCLELGAVLPAGMEELGDQHLVLDCVHSHHAGQSFDPLQQLLQVHDFRFGVLHLAPPFGWGSVYWPGRILPERRGVFFSFFFRRRPRSRGARALPAPAAWRFVMASWRDLLVRFGACSDARTWASSLRTSVDAKAAWDACPRGDWLLWIARRIGVQTNVTAWALADWAVRERAPVVLDATGQHEAAAALRALDPIVDFDSSLRARETCWAIREEAWGIHAADAAATAADASDAADAAADDDAAATAASAAADAAADAADAAAAADAVAAADAAATAATAAATAADAADAADAAAGRRYYERRDQLLPAARARVADRVRQHLPWAVIEDAMNRALGSAAEVRP